MVTGGGTGCCREENGQRGQRDHLSHRRGQGWGHRPAPGATAPSKHRTSPGLGFPHTTTAGQPQAAEPSATPGHTCPMVSHGVPQCPTRVPQCPTRVPHADSLAPAHAEPQHRARGNQTHPLLAKPSGDPSAPLPPCWWGSGGVLVGWMEHVDVTQPEGDGLRGQSCHAVETDGWPEQVRGRWKHFLTSQPSEIRAILRGGANPVRLCRKWQNPGRHPPGEDTRGYAPHTCHEARGAGTDGELGKGH